MKRSEKSLLKESFDRERDLRNRLNTFLVRTMGLPEIDYYSSLDAQAILSLKSTLSDINNILTLKVTLAFADWLAAKFLFGEEAKKALRGSVLAQKPSSNGWDISATVPVPFVAEVKCNVPINRGAVYGSAQRHGIERDVLSLTHGKPKASVHAGAYFRFLAFLDAPEIRAANTHLLRVSSACRDHMIFATDDLTIDRHDVVYGVYVTV